MARILVIEDNRPSLDLMLYLLKAFGHDATGCDVATEGLARAQGEHFDLVISDVLMPEMDGYELARRLKGDPRTASVHLIAVTALAMVGDKERALAAGFDGYVSKPIDPETFVKQIERLLPPPAHPPAVQGSTVLAVDDIPVNLEVLAGTLEPFGYRVLKAHNANEAIEQLQHTLPAVILCDVHMPGGDGFALIEHVKATEALAQIPFIFISSTAWQTVDKQRGIELGASKFILRPIDPEKLLQEVKTAIGGTDRD